MNTTQTMRVLSTLGNGPALVVFVWLAAAGQAVEQRWIESMTDLSDKTVSRALQKLTELQYVTAVEKGWQIAAAQQGVLGDILAALPGEPAQLAEPQSDGRVGNSPTQKDGVVVKESIKDLDSLTQQHQEASRKLSDSAKAVEAEPTRLERLLVAGGVWPERVPPLAARIAEHDQAAAQGDLFYADTHLTSRDVLGWLAYLRDPDQARRIETSAGALLYSNLEARRPADERHKPPYVCGHCRAIAPRCTCGDLVATLPDAYDARALAEQAVLQDGERRPTLFERWGICETCWSLPCRCAPAAAAEEWPTAAARVPVAPSATPESRLWARVLDQLRHEMQKPVFDTWAAATRLLRVENNAYVIGAPNSYARDWIQNRLTGTLARIMAPIVDRQFTIEFEVIEEGLPHV